MACSLPLEAELRSDHELQVVVGAVIEVDHVANLSPDAEALAEFHADARIQDAVRVTVGNATHLVGERAAVVGAHAEIQEAALHRAVNASRSEGRLELRSEQSLEQ